MKPSIKKPFSYFRATYPESNILWITKTQQLTKQLQVIMSARFFLALRGVPYNLCATHKRETFPNSSQGHKERVVLTGASRAEGVKHPALSTDPAPAGQPWPLSEPQFPHLHNGDKMFPLKGLL